MAFTPTNRVQDLTFGGVDTLFASMGGNIISDAFTIGGSSRVSVQVIWGSGAPTQ